MRNPIAAFVGFGEINTPRKFIDGRVAEARTLLTDDGIDVISTGPVSDDPPGNDIQRAIGELKGKDVDLLILCVAGWIPTHAIISVAMEFRHKPMILWGLTGWTENGRLITTADQAGTTGARKPMHDMGFKFIYVYSTQDSGHPIKKILSFAHAAKAMTLLRHAKIGQMGNRDMNLYGTLCDVTSVRSRIGVEIEFFEMMEIVQKGDSIKKSQVAEVIDYVRAQWKFEKPVEDATLETGARHFLAVAEKVEERGYEALSLIDVDGMKKLAKFPPAMVFMLLGEKLGICTAPENDAMGNVTQLMAHYLTGQIAAYMEFYEFFNDRVLMGVPDYVPAEIVEGDVLVTPAAFGDFSGGLLNISKVKVGRITLARLAYTDGRYGLHVATGEAVQPRPWEEAGWEPPAPQLPSLEVILDNPVDDFAQEIMSEHYHIAYGDHRELYADLCYLLDIELI